MSNALTRIFLFF